MSKAHTDNRAFLSAIAWPDGADQHDVAMIIRDAIAQAPIDPKTLSPETVTLRLAIAPPMILGLVEPQIASAVCDAIRHHGGDAFAPTYADLAARGPTLKIRDLQLIDGDLDAKLWRGPQCRIKRTNILCLVRAHLSDTVVLRTPERARLPQTYFLHHTRPSLRADYIKDAKTTKIQTSDKLDIHTTDGSVFQLDGDKFAYLILGDMRGHSDKANMDKMLDLLQHIAEHAIVDMYFPLWKAPPGVDRLRIPHAHLNNDDPAFAFYSRWCALMYQHILEDPMPRADQ